MIAKFRDILRDRYLTLGVDEIDQAIRIAEHLVAAKWPDMDEDGRGAMTYRLVSCACLNRMRGDRRRQKRIQSYQKEDFQEDLLASAGNGVTDEIEEKEEWDAFVRRLPWLSRFLIDVVKAELSERPPEDWTRANVTEFRQRLRRRFMTGSKFGIFTERQYKEAQMTLRAALHKRNERRHADAAVT